MHPIGTEFDYCFSPSMTGTHAVFTVFTYRVVAHDQVDDGFGGVGMAERLEPLDSKEFPVKAWIFSDGVLVPEVPEEVRFLIEAQQRA